MTLARYSISVIVAAMFSMGATEAQPPALDPVVVEALVNAPVEAVWKAFTEKPVIEKWMVAKTDLELKVGGTWRTSYSKDSDLNDERSIHHTILAFDPERMLAFRTIKTPKDFPYPAITRTWTVVYFELAGPGKTRVSTRMMGFENDEQGRAMRAFFERGNRTEMDALVKFFETGIPQRVQ